jgi:hypothetical protein
VNTAISIILPFIGYSLAFEIRPHSYYNFYANQNQKKAPAFLLGSEVLSGFSRVELARKSFRLKIFIFK